MAALEDDVQLQEILAGHGTRFERLPSGRLRCALTGHELKATAASVREYLNGKKGATAQLEQKLKEFEPHVVQHPQLRDKLLCNLTGSVLSKCEDAVWKHMLGKKFQKRLSEPPPPSLEFH